MASRFQDMFKDYDKEIADVERNRVDDVKAAENKWEAQRQGVMQQVAGADGERAMWLQSEYENSFGNEANEIAKINKDADKKKEGIEEERKSNEQGRSEATGLKADPGPAPEQGAPANVNAFGVVPPEPAEPPKEASPESGESQERGTFMQGLAVGAKSFAADAALNLAAIGVALTTQVQSILETVDHESALAALNQEKLAVTRDASDIKSDSILVNPPIEEGELDKDSAAKYRQQNDLEEVEGVESAVDAEKNTPALVQNAPEPRVMATVNGIDLQPPPHIPPPAANDNESETKTR